MKRNRTEPDPAEIKKYIDEARDALKRAREKFETDELTDSENNLSDARRAYARAVSLASREWRFTNVYGGYAWMYLIALLAFIFFIMYNYRAELAKHLVVGDPAINAAAWGIIGGILRAMWFLKEKVDTRTFKNSSYIYFLSIPFLGGMLGSIIYLIISGGLFALSSDKTATVNPLAVIPFAALAGYNWEWAIKIFNKIGDFLIPPSSGEVTPESAKNI